MRSSSIKDMYRTCQAAASALPSPNRQYQWKCPPCRRSLSTVLPLILPTITLTRPLLTPCSGAAPSAQSLYALRLRRSPRGTSSPGSPCPLQLPIKGSCLPPGTDPCRRRSPVPFVHTHPSASCRGKTSQFRSSRLSPS